MKIYRCKQPWFSGLANEPEPRWPRDYDEPEEMVQHGTGKEALANAFSQSYYAGRGLNMGDVVGLDEGRRCWTWAVGAR
jgi:hypothetical protein